MENKIIWEDIKLQTDLISGTIEEVDDSDYEEEYDDDPINNLLKNQDSLITSPFGVYRLHDYFNPMKQYDWHIAHTNFNITEKVVEDLSLIDGVELLLPVSRYRFMVAFGKAFNQENVKDLIHLHFKVSPSLSTEVEQKIKELKQIYEYWAVYYLNENTWDYATESDYVDKIYIFKRKKIEQGGVLITHENNF